MLLLITSKHELGCTDSSHPILYITYNDIDHYSAWTIFSFITGSSNQFRLSNIRGRKALLIPLTNKVRERLKNLNIELDSILGTKKPTLPKRPKSKTQEFYDGLQDENDI